MDNMNLISSGWSTHPQAPLFDILSGLTQLTALKLGLTLKQEVEAPLELPRLQTVDVFLTVECRPAREYGSLQSTIVTRLTLWGDRLASEDFNPPQISEHNLPFRIIPVVNWLATWVLYATAGCLLFPVALGYEQSVLANLHKGAHSQPSEVLLELPSSEPSDPCV